MDWRSDARGSFLPVLILQKNVPGEARGSSPPGKYPELWLGGMLRGWCFISLTVRPPVASESTHTAAARPPRWAQRRGKADDHRLTPRTRALTVNLSATRPLPIWQSLPMRVLPPARTGRGESQPPRLFLRAGWAGGQNLPRPTRRYTIGMIGDAADADPAAVTVARVAKAARSEDEHEDYEDQVPSLFDVARCRFQTALPIVPA